MPRGLGMQFCSRWSGIGKGPHIRSDVNWHSQSGTKSEIVWKGEGIGQG